MAKLTAQEYAEKWARRLKGSTEDIRRGIDRVIEAPGEAAARSKDLMLQKVTAAINDGTWESQVRSVSKEDWQRAAKDKGIGRIAQGVDSAAPRQAAMADRLLAAVDSSVAAANRVKRGTLEDNIQRMTIFVRSMSEKKLRRPGSR
jgi:hypothetical protein